MANKTWDDERDQNLTDWWGEGLTAPMIAQRLGGGITDSAVLKRKTTLGLALRRPGNRHWALRDTPWTEELIAKAKGLHGEGKSAKAIAAALGFTRNSVIGKIYRLGLSRPRTERLAKEPKERKPRKRPCRRQLIAKRVTPNDPGLQEAYRASLVAPTENPRQIATLTNDACRWPVGDPAHVEFYFCGAPMADFRQGNPYCPYHNRVAYREPAQ